MKNAIATALQMATSNAKKNIHEKEANKGRLKFNAESFAKK